MYAHKRSNDILYPGLIAAWSAKGKTNDDADRAVLRDLTGNGHDITLNNFAFSEMSGYGGIQIQGFKSWIYNGPSSVKIINDYKIIWERKNTDYVYGFYAGLNPTDNKSIYLKSDKECVVCIDGKYIGTDGIKHTVSGPRITIQPNVITKIENVIDFDYPEAAVDIYNNVLFFSTGVDEPTTIELIPEYPDALVLDGVDDYGICENMPIMTDYTIIVKRKYVNGNGPIMGKAKLIDTGAFIFEGPEYKTNTYNYGSRTTIKYNDNDVSFQTSNSYNGQKIDKGEATDTDGIYMGTVRKNDSRFWQGAFYSAYLFDRSLDEQEIKTFVRKYIDEDYLLPSEIPNPDCYYDFTNGDNTSETRDTITDLSGNGNDAVAHNFAWNEEGSGYKDGALILDGVDDYISLDAFDSGFKTMFMVCKPYNKYVILYDQRQSTGTQNDYAIYNDDSIAYSARNTNDTYINSIKNKTLNSDDLINKKHLIMINSDLTQKQKPIIGSVHYYTQYFANMELYKFLGFKEKLTDEQIQYVIKKYNLLDGVDEIEVS